MIVQLVEDLDYQVSKSLHNKILEKTTSRGYTIKGTDNQLISIFGNKFSGLSNTIKFEHHLDMNSGEWKATVVDLSNNKVKLLRKGCLMRGEDII